MQDVRDFQLRIVTELTQGNCKPSLFTLLTMHKMTQMQFQYLVKVFGLERSGSSRLTITFDNFFTHFVELYQHDWYRFGLFSRLGHLPGVIDNLPSDLSELQGALIGAVEYGNLNIVEYLLSKLSSEDQKNSTYECCKNAIMYEQLEILKYLHGIITCSWIKISNFQTAVCWDRSEIIDFIMNQPNFDVFQGFQYVVSHLKVEVVRKFLDVKHFDHQALFHHFLTEAEFWSLDYKFQEILKMFLVRKIPCDEMILRHFQYRYANSPKIVKLLTTHFGDKCDINLSSRDRVKVIGAKSYPSGHW